MGPRKPGTFQSAFVYGHPNNEFTVRGSLTFKTHTNLIQRQHYKLNVKDKVMAVTFAVDKGGWEAPADRLPSGVKQNN